MGVDQSRFSRREKALFLLWRWFSQIWDPLYTITGVREMARFLMSWRAYQSLAGAELARPRDAHPQLHDRTAGHALDAHYFYVAAWAMRGIVAAAPSRHVDIASQPVFSGILSAVLPVTFLDYRPLAARLERLECVAGDILALPFSDGSLESVSCLHVAEHIGLGRYGDPLDPNGTRKAATELARVVAPGGNLYFAVPVGRPRLCFNAHRIHAAETIREYFPELELTEFSALLDDGIFHQNREPAMTRDSVYALGMFRFTRPLP